MRLGVGTSGILLLAACAPAAPAQPAAAPPAAQPTSAPAATVPPATAVKPTQAAPSAGKPAAAQALKLGVLLPYSKVYAALGESITNGMQLYFDSLGGTIAGRTVEMIKEDEEADPAVGLRKMRKLVEQDQVDLTTGIVSTAVVYAVRDYLHENKVLFVCSNAGGNDLTRKNKSPYIFRSSFSNAQPSLPMGEYIFKNYAKRVVTAAADYGAGRESIAAFKDGFVKAGGTIVAEIYPPFQNTDYAPFIEQIRSAKPEAVYTFFAGSDAVNFVKQFDEFGLKKDIKLTGSGFLLEEDVFPGQGAAAIGGITGLHYATTLDNPENKAFSDAYTRKFNKPTDVYAVQGYDTARMISDALNKTQGNTQDKDAVIKAMEATTFASPRGPFKMDPATHNAVFNIYARETRDRNGKPENVVLATFPDVRDPG